MTSIDLGFLENCEDWLLTNKFFRSKLGGKPAWLELKKIPSPNELLCDECSEPCIFLCQIYAPLEEKKTCFHRMIYLFVCLNANCYKANENRNIKVYRSQLPRNNEFYDCEPPSEDEPSDPVPPPVALCAVCGCRGPQQCSRCKNVNYCGVVHQRIDWKHGHKTQCGANGVKGTASNPILFAQYEIVIEQEEAAAPGEKLSEEEVEKKQMEEYNKLVAEGKTGELSTVSEGEFDKYAEQCEDKYFTKFKKRIAGEPEQVLRYHRGGEPLWISSALPSDIPPCDLCGSRRVFEFQAMPQMLNSLKNENIDWGTLAVYTCEQSCNTADGSYAKEFVYKQDVISTETSSSVAS